MYDKIPAKMPYTRCMYNIMILANSTSTLCSSFPSWSCMHTLQGLCESCLPLLLEKLGDTNPRIRDSSKESIMFIAGLKDGGIRSYTHIIIKPIKNQNAWRPVLGVLTLLQVQKCECVWVCVCMCVCVRVRVYVCVCVGIVASA